MLAQYIVYEPCLEVYYTVDTNYIAGYFLYRHPPKNSRKILKSPEKSKQSEKSRKNDYYFDMDKHKFLSKFQTGES